MPSQHLNGTQIADNAWVVSSAASSPQMQRIAEQAQLPIESSEAAVVLHEIILHDADSWHQIEGQKYNLLVAGDSEIADIQMLIKNSGQSPAIIFIDFPVFTDGRGYSLARLLKRSEWFTGQIAAIGDILRDQVFYYWRCGFDKIIPRHDQNIQACQNALHLFSHAYQPSARDPKELQIENPN